MADEGSEEKDLPPSQRKLRELRRRGQVPRSTDMVSAAAMAVGFGYLALRGHTFVQGFNNAIQEVSRQNADDGILSVVHVTKQISDGLFPTTLVLFVFIIMATILSIIIVNRGVVFSPLRFDINSLNPAEGIKRIFALKSIVDLIKKLILCGIYTYAAVKLMELYAKEPFNVPSCGLWCLNSLLEYLVRLNIAVAVLLLLIFGMLDVGLQRWLFTRQNKMSKTEAKKDRKEDEGSPEVKGHQRRMRQEVLQTTNKYSAEDATIIIEGFDVIVGMRFVRGETPLPVLVSKGLGERAISISNMAAATAVPRYFDEELASGLYRTHEVGGSLTDLYFDPFIMALKALNLV